MRIYYAHNDTPRKSAPRQFHGDESPLARLRHQVDRAAMRLDELPGERQTEAQRTLAVAGDTRLGEAVERARHRVGGHPGAVIGHPAPRRRRRAVAMEHEPHTLAGAAARVTQQ